jgi:hypothetical protein
MKRKQHDFKSLYLCYAVLMIIYYSYKLHDRDILLGYAPATTIGNSIFGIHGFYVTVSFQYSSYISCSMHTEEANYYTMR